MLVALLVVLFAELSCLLAAALLAVPVVDTAADDVGLLVWFAALLASFAALLASFAALLASFAALLASFAALLAMFASAEAALSLAHPARLSTAAAHTIAVKILFFIL